MKTRLPKIFWASLIATIVLLSSCTNQVADELPLEDSSALPSPEIVSGDSEELQKRQVFPELGISLVIPDELFVITNADYNSEDPTLIDSYQLYIQNYGYPEGPASGDFQIYGFYQFNLPKISWEEFEGIKNDSVNYEYINDLEIGGLRGFDTQYSGQRNRFVYIFHYRDGTLTFAVSEPTEAIKIRADQILSTLKVVEE